MNEPLKVLVVDDDALDRRAARRALRGGDQPVAVEEAASCAEALARLEDGTPPDVVLLDYQLPDGDGLSLIRRLQAQGITVPVVMLTGHGDEMVAVELMKAGAADYLSKAGLNSEALWRSLRGLLRLRRAEAETAQERRAGQETQRQNEERLRFLYDTTSTPDLTFEQKLDRLLEEGCRQFGLEVGLLARVEGERYEVIRSLPAGVALPAGFVCGLDRTFCSQALRQAGAFAVRHAADSEWRQHPAHTEFGVESYLGAVIWSGGGKWGNLAFSSPRPHAAPFTAGDKEYVRLMAQWVGGELVRRQAEVSLRRSEERYRSLVDATAQIIWATSDSGEIADEQPQWRDFTGQSFGEYRGWGWVDAVHPEDRRRTAEAWAGAVAARTPFETEHRLRRRDGAYRAMTVRAVPVLEGSGAVREWVGVHTDVTERRQAEDRLRVLAEASTLLAASLDYDRTLAELARLVAPTLADECTIDLLSADGVPRRVATARAGESAESGWGAGESAASRLCVPLVARGRTLGTITLLLAGVGRHYETADVEMAEEIARRAALAVDNARLYHEAHARAERESLLNRIGQTLRDSLDPDVILETATREVGRAMGASRCLWANGTGQGESFEIVAQQYTASGVPALTGTYAQSVYPPEMLAQWRAGECVAVADVDADPRGPLVRRPVAPGASPKAFLICPVLLRGEWIGLFGVHQVVPRAWTRDEVALLSSITDMLALAVDNARRYAHERHVADRLQAAFLPDIPDHLHGLDLAKTYRSGLEEAQVGGDLYDAFALDDGRVGLVIADVSGKGLGAAVQTATIRYSLRAFASEAAAPGLVLRRLNRTLCGEASGLGEHFVTLFYGVYDPSTGRLTYASAGHETQLIKRADGGTTLLHANGPILGITDHAYEQEAEYLRPGDALILFTDGLTEARAAGTREFLNLEGVTEFLTGLGADHGAGALTASLERMALDWTGGRPQDDLALLVARRTSGAAAGETPELGETAAEAADEFLFGFTFPSSPDYAAEVRQAVAHWMALLGFDRAQTEDFQTAVTEAVTNAVRHGSPGGVADRFRVSGRRRPLEGFAVEIADGGPGLPASIAPPGVPAMPAPEATGGRGLPLMHALADEVTILPADAGLHLRLVKTRPALRRK